MSNRGALKTTFYTQAPPRKDLYGKAVIDEAILREAREQGVSPTIHQNWQSVGWDLRSGLVEWEAEITEPGQTVERTKIVALQYAMLLLGGDIGISDGDELYEYNMGTLKPMFDILNGIIAERARPGFEDPLAALAEDQQEATDQENASEGGEDEVAFDDGEHEDAFEEEDQEGEFGEEEPDDAPSEDEQENASDEEEWEGFFDEEQDQEGVSGAEDDSEIIWISE